MLCPVDGNSTSRWFDSRNHQSTLMVLLSILTTIVALAQSASAEIQCCGELGKWDEDKAWAYRADFCNNPRGAALSEEDEDGFVYGKAERRVEKEIDRRKSGQIKVDYFYGRVNVGQNFDNCWRATQELLEQCARQGKAFGSWKEGDEAYGMTLTGELNIVQPKNTPELDVSRRSIEEAGEAGPRRLRKRLAKRSVNDLSSIESHAHLSRLVRDGEFFDVDGEDLHVKFHDTVAPLPKRDIPGTERDLDGLWRRAEGLQTTEGMAYHWNETYHSEVNLAEIIRADLARMREEERARAAWNVSVAAHANALGKRDDPSSYLTCWNEYLQGFSAGYTWTVIEAGTFLRRPVPTRCVGNEYLSWGMTNHILKLQESDEACESYSMDLNMDELKYLVRRFARSQRAVWKKCYKQDDLSGTARCADKWRASKGACFVALGRQRMMWQRGFFLSYSDNMQYRSANVYFIHAQGPTSGLATDCWGGCCEHCDKIPGFSTLTQEFCDKYAQGDKKSYYATCEDWDSNKCHS